MRNRKAFTMIEVIITATILSLICAGMVTFLYTTYKETDRVVAKNSSRTAANGLYATLMNSIRPAKKLQVVSPTKMLVTDTSDKVTTFEFNTTSKAFLKDGKEVFIPKFAKTKNTITSLTFTSGTPAEKTVIINLALTSKTNDAVSSTGFNTQFLCRNN